jgi:hypothetical protein
MRIAHQVGGGVGSAEMISRSVLMEAEADVEIGNKVGRLCSCEIGIVVVVVVIEVVEVELLLFQGKEVFG